MEDTIVIWFEIPVNDLERAKEFYEAVFPVKLVPQGKKTTKRYLFPMKPDSFGASGTIVKGDKYIPSPNGTLVYFCVEDIDATRIKVLAHGGKVLEPKTSINEYGFTGKFQDCEGNNIGIHSMT